MVLRASRLLQPAWALPGVMLLVALLLVTGCGGSVSVVGRWEDGTSYLLLRPDGRFEGELGVAGTRGAWKQDGDRVEFVPEREEGGLLGGAFTGRLLDRDTMAFQVSGIPGELVLRRVVVAPVRR